MRWTPGGRSRDLEDRRGAPGRRGGLGGGRMSAGGLGAGGFVVLLVLSLVFGQDFLSLAGGGGATPTAAEAPIQDPAEENMVRFVSFVLDSNQAFWERTAPALGTQYQRAKLVLFRDATSTGCGYGQSAAGPFYCPADGNVYIDLSFFEELKSRFGAPGDFAQAYVLAHEVGHHVQNVLGTSTQVRSLQQRNPGQANALSIALELQADCYAGVWGHTAARQGLLSEGDVEEGLAAAAAVGDDRIQRQTTGRVNPESWTHGSSDQRMQWFMRGFESGQPGSCDTFSR